jgi:putative transposase
MTAKITQSGKIASCKNFIRLVRKNIYPNIDFSLAKNNHYKEKDYLDSLTHTAITHDFTHNGAEILRLQKDDTPTSQDILYHIGDLDKTDITEMFDSVFETVIRLAKFKNILPRKMDVAVDMTDGYKFYGDHEHTPMVVGTKPEKGTTWAYKFATITVVVAGFRVTLKTLSKSQFDSIPKLVEELITYAKRKISIGIVYMDREFFNVPCILTLEKLGVKYLMPAIANSKIEKIIAENPINTVMDYEMVSTSCRRGLYKESATFKLCIVQSNRNPEWKFTYATNLEVDEKNAKTWGDRYAKRWGIETAFRVQDAFLVRTTSKNYSVRLFYFLFSVCLYNLWILANIIVGLFFGSIPEKPIITAKMFATLLYTIALSPPDG